MATANMQAANVNDRTQTPTNDVGDTLLAVKSLKVAFKTRDGLLEAVKGVSFDLHRGQTLCIVGESGCGKSTMSMALVGLLPDNAIASGDVSFDGSQMLNCSENSLAQIRGRRIGVIFQDPARSLNPVLTIGRQIGEVLRKHLGMTKDAIRARIIALLAEVGINDPELRIGQYPHELSGGLKQRVMIAMAIACEPDLLIADEPTTALDVTVQRQVLGLLRGLQEKRRLALILVTHDFGVVSAMAEHVAVMYAGRIVEFADVFELFNNARHPYTKALLNANPRRVLAAASSAPLRPIPGSPPSPLESIPGCSFSPRCPERHAACVDSPREFITGTDHKISCWLVQND